MTLQPLTLEGSIAILPLRERNQAALRTDHVISKDSQEDWYYRVTSRWSDARWWEVIVNKRVNGYCGVENIDWIARIGELSLLVADPLEWTGVFDALQYKAFNELNLKEVHAEVYECSPDKERWLKAAEIFGAYMTKLPMRKFHDGRLWDAHYISWRLPV